MRDTAAIRVTDVHKRFGASDVLRGVSLEAQDGEVVSILGSSGSGKSTLLRCMNLLEIPDAGDVLIAGEAVHMKRLRNGRRAVDRLQIGRLRTRVAMVFQSFNLWSHLTVLENIVEAPVHVQKRPRNECVAEAVALLEKVGIGDKGRCYPAQLSGGQQQRVAIARALAVHPKLMLFDEPTSALDPELVGEVLDVMRDLAREGRTMIVVTHEMGFARDISSCIAFLHQGIVQEEGTPGEVFGGASSERLRRFMQRSLERDIRG